MITRLDTSQFQKMAPRLALLCLAILLQIQVTLFATDDYLGLRVNSADFLLPFFGIVILFSLLLKRSYWPIWQKPFGYWAPFLLTSVLVLAVLNGYRIQNDWSSWAVLNKGLGWFILMAYLALGAWFVTNRAQDISNYFFIPFLFFTLLITIIEGFSRLFFYEYLGRSFSILSLDLGYDLAGLMVNRNAFAFLYLCALVVSSIYLFKVKELKLFETVLFKGFWLFTPIFLIFNASRTSFLVLVPLILYLIMTNWRFFTLKILPLIIVGALALPFSQNNRLSNAFSYVDVLQEQSVSYLAGDSDSQSLEENIYKGDQTRLQILKDSFLLYTQHPFTGAGIGSVIEHQKTIEGRRLVAVIDNTPVWILTEMGPIGLLSFAAVYVCMIIALRRQSADLNSFREVFCYSVIFVLLAFGIFSLFHEILYSRFLWVFLGIGLAIPRVNKHPT